MRKVLSTPLMLITLLGVASTSVAETTVVDCATEIAGSIIEFGSQGSSVNEDLAAHGMMATRALTTTESVPWLTGNECAPMEGGHGYNHDFQIRTLEVPWSQIGLTVWGGLLEEIRTLTLTAYDANDVQIGHITRQFDPGLTHSEFNQGIVFLGFESTAPIYSIGLAADNPNIAWDELRYVRGSGVLSGAESWGALKGRYR